MLSAETQRSILFTVVAVVSAAFLIGASLVFQIFQSAVRGCCNFCTE
jgi:hypothetical protein